MAIQRFEVIVDWDDYFSFPLLESPEGLTSAFVSHFALFICLDLCRRVRKHSEESNRKSNSSCRRSELIPKFSLQEHWTSFIYPCYPLLFLSVVVSFCFAFLLPQSVFCLSLCEVLSSCCFPCGDYNNVFWHRRVSCCLLLSVLQNPQSHHSSSDTKNTSPPFSSCSGSKQFCSNVKGFSEFNQPWGWGTPLCLCSQLAVFCEVMGWGGKSEQMPGHLVSDAS